MNRCPATLCLILTFSTFGCALGPPALRHSSNAYNRAIQTTAEEQMLLNLVRLKYRDAPLFLDVGSVSAQFNLGTSADISGTIFENVGPTNLPNILGLGGKVSYEDKPTITYTPLHGEEFARRIMTPLELETIVQLYYSGWSVDRILRLTVQRLNGLENAMTASGPTPDRAPAFADFSKATKLLRRLQLKGLVNIGYASREVALSDPVDPGRLTGADLVTAAREGYRFREAVDSDALVLTGSRQTAILRFEPGAGGLPETNEVVELLRLDPRQPQYTISRSFTTTDPTGQERFDSLAVSTRSLIGVLFYLAQAVETPREHEERGIVTVTRDAQGRRFDWKKVTGDIFQVHSRKRKPSRAAVAVPYRGYWFYIDDADLTSKSTLVLLGQLFSFQAGGAKTVTPLLTIPIGG